MSGLPWTKFYWGDWLAGTAILSGDEKVVYISLLALIYDGGAPVLEDYKRIARVSGVSAHAARISVAALIDLGKIIRLPQGLWNERAEKELFGRGDEREDRGDERSLSDKRRAAAQASWAKRKSKTDANAMQNANLHDAKPDFAYAKTDAKGDLHDANAMQMQCKADANAMQTSRESAPAPACQKSESDNKKPSIEGKKNSDFASKIGEASKQSSAQAASKGQAADAVSADNSPQKRAEAQLLGEALAGKGISLPSASLPKNSAQAPRKSAGATQDAAQNPAQNAAKELSKVAADSDALFPPLPPKAATALAAELARETRKQAKSQPQTAGNPEKQSRACKKGTRIPDDFAPDLSIAVKLGLTLEQAQNEAKRFIQYYRAAPNDKGGCRAAWPPVWEMWCGRAQERIAQKNPGSNAAQGAPIPYEKALEQSAWSIERHFRELGSVAANMSKIYDLTVERVRHDLRTVLARRKAERAEDEAKKAAEKQKTQAQDAAASFAAMIDSAAFKVAYLGKSAEDEAAKVRQANPGYSWETITQNIEGAVAKKRAERAAKDKQRIAQEGANSNAGE